MIAPELPASTVPAGSETMTGTFDATIFSRRIEPERELGWFDVVVRKTGVLVTTASMMESDPTVCRRCIQYAFVRGLKRGMAYLSRRALARTISCDLETDATV